MDWIEWGYIGLFVASFLAATILPVASEALFIAMLFSFNPWVCLFVAGTGNKVEDFGVGFYTKYGDGGVDLSPIADLMKTEVFEIAKYLQIIDVIQNAAPTDGLWGDDRTDEDQLGATYPELEWAMEMYQKNNSQSSFNSRQKEIFAIYTKHHLQNQHKMKPIPVCKIPKEFL